MKYKLSDHAFMRFKERVNVKQNRTQAENWVNQAIHSGTLLGNSKEGYQYYKYKEYKIVVGDKNKVVTISFYSTSGHNAFKKEVNEQIRKMFKKKLDPLYKQKKRMQIQFYEHKLNQLKTNNPQTKRNIQTSIDNIEGEIGEITAQIETFLNLFEHYHLFKHDIEKKEF